MKLMILAYRPLCLIFLLVSASATTAYPSLMDRIFQSHCQIRQGVSPLEAYQGQLFLSADNVLQENCVACHREGGLAFNAGASLILRPNVDSTSEEFNYQSLAALVESRGVNHLLSKAVGVAHGGGAVLDTFGTDFETLEAFLNSLVTGGCASYVKAPEKSGAESLDSLFHKAEPEKVLRRAAMVLARRLPTPQELERVQAQPAALQSTVAQLLEGPGFHEFLVRAANDRLLVDAFNNGLCCLQPSLEYPNWIRAQETLRNAYGAEFWQDVEDDLFGIVSYSLTQEPLELMAWVIENDRSYKEVVTAAHTMVTPITADIFNSGVEWSSPLIYDGNYDDFHVTFAPGENRGQIDRSLPVSGQQCVAINAELQYCAPESFSRLERPHAGVLDSPAFLTRYPTTETNRNRARARWAYQFFLGVDVEASASRTTDAEALRDTNNPTLNNPACIVCHKTLDPVAGTFQNYDPSGHYRPYGADALPLSYKTATDDTSEPGYQEGDIWYRGMRSPGFNGEEATDPDRSLPWLGEKIGDDPRFPIGTVEFWWAPVMGSTLLSTPEDPTLPGYDQQLRAFAIQRREISRLAEYFVVSDYRLKPLLAAMTLSPFFAVGPLKVDIGEAASLVKALNVQVDRRLTPEELLAKTYELTGVIVGESGPTVSLEMWGSRGMLYRASTMLGGIDSFRVTRRSRVANPLSVRISEQHGTSLACSVEFIEANVRDGQRMLLNGVEFSAVPKDDEVTRSKISDLYRRLLGLRVTTDSEEVDTLVQLLIEGHSLGPIECAAPVDNSGISRANHRLRMSGAIDDTARWGFSDNSGWRFVLNFFFTHYDFLYD